MYKMEYTVLLLKSMALNYPIIKHLGLELGKLLFVLTEPGQMKAAASLFSDMEAPVISEFTKKSDCKKIIASANSSFVIFPYVESKASNDYLHFLGSLVRSGSLGSPGLNAIPVVISERFPYGTGMENIFLVSLTGNLESLKKGLIYVVPPDNKLEVVFDRIRCNVRGNMTPDKKSFTAAACFLYPNMPLERRVLDFLYIKDHIQSLIEFKFDMETQVVITEVLLSYLWRMAAVSGFRRDGLFIVLDECQNFISGERCMVNQILSEGRKFSLNLILATQGLGLKKQAAMSQKIMQCGLVLFFQPDMSQVRAQAKLIDMESAQEWATVLQRLKPGEFVALGSLSLGGITARKPLKASNRL